MVYTFKDEKERLAFLRGSKEVVEIKPIAKEPKEPKEKPKKKKAKNEPK